MSLSIKDVLEAQMILSGVRPLSAPQAPDSLSQIKIRMAQEAINNDSADLVKLNHLIGTLIGHPNGPVRFHLQEAIRAEGTSEAELRGVLKLKEHDHTLETPSFMKINDHVRGIFELAQSLAASRDEDLRIQDILHAVVSLFTNNYLTLDVQPEILARLLVNSIKSGTVRGLEQ